jgi:hypothetical protein
MIQIICTNCKTELLLDDAFAGGVCRCQHCGAIQKVPANAKKGPGAVPATAAATSPSLLVKPVRVSPPPPMGVAKKSKPSEPKKESSTFGLVLGIAIGLLVVLIVLGILFHKSG